MSRHSQNRQLPPQEHTPQWRRWLAPALIALTIVVIAVGIIQLVLNDRPATAPPAAQPTYTGGPRLRVDQELFDYGDVKFGTPIKTVIKVKNVGDEVLVLEREPRVELIEGC